MIIGICGGSGSGKSSILNGLKSHYHELRPAVISLDNYYFPKERQAKDKNGRINFDLPTALDREQLYADLLSLISGKAIEVTEYTYNQSNKSTKIIIEPSELTIIEGLFVFTYTEIFELLDFSIFVDVCEKMQLERRMERDLFARGYSKEAVLYQWENHVLTCYEQYIQPYREKASLVLMNDVTKEELIQKVTLELDRHPQIGSLKNTLIPQ